MEWFSETQQYLQDKNLFSLSPNRILNCDETSLPLCPEEDKVFVERGVSNVYKEADDSKECLTLLWTYSDDGSRAPPMLMFNYKREIPAAVIKKIPAGWGIGTSKNGWMTSESFMNM